MTNSARRPRRRSEPRAALVSVRLLAVFTAATIVAMISGTLTYLAVQEPWVALIAALAAGVGAIQKLHDWTGP